jgi:hypothetical protein
MSTSGNYRSFHSAMLLGGVNLAVDDIGLLIVGERYVPDFQRHSRRSDIEPFEASGDGYTKGGVKSTATVDYTATGLTVTLGGARLAKATIRARGGVYYLAQGGDPSEDTLLFYHDFGPEPIECVRGIVNISPSIIDFK